MLKDPQHPYKPLTLHYSTTTSMYQGHPSSSIPMSTTSVPNISQSSVYQVSQVDPKGKGNTLTQNQPLTQQGTSSSNPPVDTSNPAVSQNISIPSIINPHQNNPLIKNPINQGNTLTTSKTHGNLQNIGQGNPFNQWTQGPNMPLTSQYLMMPSSSLLFVPQVMQNQMGPETYISPPQSTILQGMLNQGNPQPLINNAQYA